MKTAISVPDEVFAEAERLTHKLKKSRSQLYTDAMREYIARHDPEAITEALNRVYESVDSHMDPVIEAVGRRLLERVEW